MQDQDRKISAEDSPTAKAALLTQSKAQDDANWEEQESTADTRARVHIFENPNPKREGSWGWVEKGFDRL